MDFNQKIAHLEKLTIRDIDCSSAVNYFLTIYENEPLLERSSTLKDRHVYAFFNELLHPVAKHYGEEVTVEKMHLMSIKGCHLVHGLAIFSNGVDMGLYFFAALKTGLAFTQRTAGKTTEEDDFFRLIAFEFETEDADQVSSSHTMTLGNTRRTYH
jgi:hypothetical protein